MQIINEDIRQELWAVWAEMGPDDRRTLLALAGEVRVNEATKDEIWQCRHGDNDCRGASRGGDWVVGNGGD